MSFPQAGALKTRLPGTKSSKLYVRATASYKPSTTTPRAPATHEQPPAATWFINITSSSYSQGGKEGATVENFDQGEETRSGSSKEKQLARVPDAWTALVVETQEPG